MCVLVGGYVWVGLSGLSFFNDMGILFRTVFFADFILQNAKSTLAIFSQNT